MENTVNNNYLKDYFKIAGIPLIIALIVEIGAFFIDYTSYIVWGTNVLIFIYLTTLLKYKHQKKLETTIAWVLILGLILGLAVAIMRISLGYKAYLIFNLLAEPALFAAIGALVASFLYLILPIKNKNINNGRKEVTHGRK